MKLTQPSGKKKTSYIFVLAVILAIIFAGSFAVSALMDWNKFKPMIEAKASEALGRKVTIAGKIGGVILPMTKITAENIIIDNVPGGKAEHFLTMQQLELELSPMALLSGKLDIGMVRLLSPDIYLEKLANGRGNWEFKAEPGAAAQGQADSKKPVAIDSTSPLASVPALRDIKIESGQVHYRDLATGETQDLGDLNLKAALDLAAQKINLDGKAEYQGQPATLALDVKPAGEMLDTNAKLQLAMGTFSFKGMAANILRNPSAKLEAKGLVDLASNLKPAIKATGQVQYGEDQIAIRDLRINAADINATGDVTVKLQDTPFVDLKLNADKIDVMALANAAQQWQKSLPNNAAPKTSKKSAAKKSNDGLGFKGNANISIGKLIASGVSADNVKIQASTINGKDIALQHFAIQTIGDTAIDGDGTFDVPANAFNGRMTATIGNLQKLAAGFGQGDNEWIKSQPSRVELKSDVVYANNTVKLQNYNLAHGELKSHGNLSYAMGEKPVIEWQGNLSHPSIKKLAAKPLPMDGKLAVDGDIGITLANGAPVYSSLQGKARTALGDGVYNGMDLKKISLQLKELNQFQDFVNVLNQAKQQGTTTFRSVSADWSIARGIAQTQNIAIDSDVVKGRGAGQIDVGAMTLDVKNTIAFVDHPKVPPVGLRLFGQVQAPQTEFDTAALGSYFAQRAINKVIEKNVDMEKLQNKLDKKLGTGGGKLLNKLLGQ